MITAEPTYYALRVSPEADADRWWDAARAESRDAPYGIRALLGGRRRIELSAGEVAEALEWAQDLDGWGDDVVPPLRVHPRVPALA